MFIIFIQFYFAEKNIEKSKGKKTIMFVLFMVISTLFNIVIRECDNKEKPGKSGNKQGRGDRAALT